VVAGLEALMTIKDAGLPLKLNLEVIDFTDEEGRYVGFLGSRALAGVIEPDDIRNPRDDRRAFETALAQTGLTEATIFEAKRDPRSLAGYLELHVEQGARLSDANLELGIVTGIVGLRSFKLTFLGRANHAGTTPVSKRFDAAQGACAFTLAAREFVLDTFPESVVNVGNMVFEPGAFNIVPERVTVDLEFRSETISTLDALEAGLLDRAAREAGRFGLQIDIQPVGKVPPAPMAKTMQTAIMQASQHLALRTMTLPSGAGHDAQSLALVCPTGMIFVPSVGGISHSPREFTEWEDCVNGANVLLETVILLAHQDECDAAAVVSE
jgi:N-carbamoyl-L-amino-acid hydrolase